MRLLVRSALTVPILTMALVWGGQSPLASASGAAPSSVSVVSHRWHTDLAVRIADLPPASWPDVARFPGAEFIEIGWGDRDFFRAPRDSVGLALQAAFCSRGSALRVIWVDGPIDRYFVDSEVVEIPISGAALERLVTYIRDSYALTAAGEPIDLGPGPWPRSRYYEATGRYHLFNSSNQWTARALQSAGLPFEPARALTVGSVMCQAARIGRPARLRHDCSPLPAAAQSP